jgi:methionine-gamma-lyase
MEDSKNQHLEEFYLECGFATRALHAGEHVGQPQRVAHAGAIYQTSTFVFQDVAEGAAIFAKEQPGYVYTRLGNPTVKLLEAKINALEGGELKKANPDVCVYTQAFASGMAAIAAALMAVASAGDTIVMGDVLYGATTHLADNVLKRMGIRVVEVDTSDLAKLEAVLASNPQAKALYLETPTNPLLACTDIAVAAGMAKAINPDMLVMVDNTFATPFLQRPLEYGADVVLHSTTKYINGHGTTVGGLVTTTDEAFKNAVYTVLADVGASPSPFDCFLINQGLKTLPLRMRKHCANAMAVARFLDAHSKVERTHYPGLESSPDHAVARKQMSDFGGMVSFELKGGVEAGRRLMDTIELFTLAVSLGCVDSLIQHPASMTHACVPREKRLAGGVTDGLVRVSVGIEDEEDLLLALDKGLAKV